MALWARVNECFVHGRCDAFSESEVKDCDDTQFLA